MENAKARRVSVCNALDTLIVHAKRLGDLPALLRALGEKHRCTVFADPQALEALKGHYPPELLHPAREEHYGTEFLSMKMSVRTVDDLDADQIASHRSDPRGHRTQSTGPVRQPDPEHQQVRGRVVCTHRPTVPSECVGTVSGSAVSAPART